MKRPRLVSGLVVGWVVPTRHRGRHRPNGGFREPTLRARSQPEVYSSTHTSCHAPTDHRLFYLWKRKSEAVSGFNALYRLQSLGSPQNHPLSNSKACDS